MHGGPSLYRDYYDDVDLQRLAEDVVTKSSGVFLWAQLAVGTLIDGLSMGDTIEELQERLCELPPELEELFTFMLQRIPPRYRKEAYRQVRITIHWYSQVQEPMSSSVLSFASEYESIRRLLASKDPAALGSLTQRTQRVEIRLRTCCLGLLETSTMDTVRLEIGETGRPYTAGNVTVHFMHKTVLDYLSRAHVWEQIRPAANSELDADLAILVGLISSMKAQDTQRTWHDWTRAVRLAIGFARRIDTIGKAGYVDLLDQFDDLMARIWTTRRDSLDQLLIPWNSEPAKAHWTNFLKRIEDFITPAHHCDDFLSFAVKCGLEQYVQEKLSTAAASVLAKQGRPLLEYAMWPLPAWSPLFGGTNPRITRSLLEGGAVPNQEFDGFTPWANALYTIVENDFRPWGRPCGLELRSRRSLHDYLDFLETLEILIAHGADPHARCELIRRSENGGRQKVSYGLQEVLQGVLHTPCFCQDQEAIAFARAALKLRSCHCTDAVMIQSKIEIVQRDVDHRASDLP